MGIYKYTKTRNPQELPSPPTIQHISITSAFEYYALQLGELRFEPSAYKLAVLTFSMLIINL